MKLLATQKTDSAEGSFRAERPMAGPPSRARPTFTPLSAAETVPSGRPRERVGQKTTKHERCAEVSGFYRF